MTIGSIDIYLDGPPEVSLNEGSGEPFAVIDLTPRPGRAYIALRTPAECDALILAAVAAKDLLLGAQEARLACANCDWHTPAAGAPGDGKCPHCGEDLTPCQCDSAVSLISELNAAGMAVRALPPGHGPNHIGNAGNVLGCDGECHPGTCGYCGARYEPDGSHVSALSGAHISAEPQQVST